MSRAALSILILVFGAGLSLWGLSRLALTNDDIMRWLPDDSPARVDYEFFRKHFSTDEYVVLAWEGCRVGDPRLAQLAEQLRVADNHRWIRNVTTGEDVLERLVLDARLSRREAEQRMRGIFFGPAGDEATCLVVALTQAGRENRPRSILCIEDAIQQVAGLHVDDVFMAGYPWVAVTMSRMIESTFERLLVWSGIAATLVAFLCLRCLALPLIGLLASGIGAGVSIGISVLLSGGLGGLTMLVPTLGFVLTMSGGLHMMRYATAVPGDARALLQVSWLPCTVSTLTTVIGVLTLTTSNYPAVREFAVLAAMTLAFSLLIQLGTLPWLISRFGAHDVTRLGRARSSESRFWAAVALQGARYRWSVALLAGVAFAVAAAGILRLRPNVEADNLFRRDASVIQGIERLEQHLGPVDRTEVVFVFDPAQSGDVLQRAEYVRSFCRYARRVPEISGTLSVTDFLPDWQSSGLLGDLRREMVKQSLQHNRLALVGDYFRLDGDRELWRVGLRFPFVDATDFSALQERASTLHARLNEVAQREWSGFASPRMVYTGATHLVHDAQESLLRDFLGSFALAFVVITPVLIVVLRSLALGAIGMLANLWPVVVVFGAIGWLGIAVDVALGMSASVALGIAVDDTTHFLLRTREKRRHGKLVAGSYVAASLVDCGPAMLATTGIACAGIATYGLSDLVVISRFALVVSAMLAAALVADALLLPALIGKSRSGSQRRQNTRLE